MNRIEQILKLVDAGYTKDEITAMMKDDPADTKETAEPAEPEETEEAQDDKKPAESSGNNDPGNVYAEALNRLTQMLQLQNINNNSFGQQPQRTAADAIAEIIMPPVKK